MHLQFRGSYSTVNCNCLRKANSQAYPFRSRARWGCRPSGPRWTRRSCPPAPTWPGWGGLGEGDRGDSAVRLSSQTAKLSHSADRGVPVNREPRWQGVVAVRRLSPMKAMPFLCSSSGSFGFSEAWPHPAHTACGEEQRVLR